MLPEQPEHAGDRLVVAVLTYQRNDDILELLPLLVTQTAELHPPGTVVVVDNDPGAGARDAVLGLVEEQGLTGVRYVHEPLPGIAHARNRALDEAADADLLVFIDDDERPAPGWLTALVACRAEHDATGVAGAVVPADELIEDAWVQAGGFFVRQRHDTGTVLPAASTANLLLDLRRVRASGDLRFDDRFGTTGGSDTLFTRQLVQRGELLVWCDEASVTDYIRSARVSREWVLQRAYRSGNSWSRCELELTVGRRARLVARARLLAVAAVRVLVGALRLLLGRLTGSVRHQARGSRTLARGRGMWAGAVGRVYGDVEYRRQQPVGGSRGVGA